MVATASGALMHVLRPDPDLICMGDIVAGLSNNIRWTGQARPNVTVAEHCLNVERHCPPEATALERLQALVHDAPEAYLGEMTYPVKRLVQSYRDIEDIWWEAIAGALGLPVEWPGWLKELDVAMALAEALQVMPAATHDYMRGLVEPQISDQALFMAENAVTVSGWHPTQAAQYFKDRYDHLYSEVFACK